MKFILVHIVFFWFVIVPGFSFAQMSERVRSEKISDCDGAATIDGGGDYKMNFTGDNGYVDDLHAYPSLSGKVKGTNYLWAFFQAPFDGWFSIAAYCPSQALSMVIFMGETDDICGEIYQGGAEIERLLINKQGDSVGLRKEMNDNFLYPMKLSQGDEIMIFFGIVEEDRKQLKFNVQFTPLSQEKVIAELTKVVDQRHAKGKSDLKISLRDRETGLPVKSQLTVTESKTFDALYRGTDFLFSLERRITVNFKVDAPGYFMYDRDELILPDEDVEMVIWLDPVREGKQMNMKGIQFIAGTSEFAPGAEVRLRRLRDFLVLNTEVKIEIQGHIHEIGEGSFAGKQLSKARAKRVMLFLIDNGVDKNRLEAVGYGNEHMIYPEAKSPGQEQANRRVEIKILKLDD
jgi:outer membrane protein OmpA-like peptidoglycan-associated protein